MYTGAHREDRCSKLSSLLKYHLDNGLKEEIVIRNDSEIGMEINSMYEENNIEDKTITCVLTEQLFNI